MRKMNSKLLLVMAIFVASAMVIMADPARLQKTTHHQVQDQTETNLKIIKRSDWNAAKPTDKSPLNSPVPYVIIHHSASPPACYTRLACQNALRSMQSTHQLVNGWDDIGYNFLIGSDGDGGIYEGRGFGVQGAHAPGYNYRSIGICLIGNWSDSVPPQNMLDKMKQLINYGVEKGHIQRNYRLHGHSQVKATECPGKALQAEIEKWEHFSGVRAAKR